MDLRAAVVAAQKRAAAQGLSGDQALSSVIDQVGVAPRQIPHSNDHECIIAEGVPALGRQILFDGSPEAKTVRNTMMPDRLMKPPYMRKIRQPEFRVLTTREFGELVYLIDCVAYPHAAEFLSNYVTSLRARSKKDAALLPALPLQVRELWGADANIEEGLDDIDRWYTTCAYAAYLDEIGSFYALLRALRLIGTPNEVVVDVFRTLGAAEDDSLKNEVWDVNMMTPAAALMTWETARLGGGYPFVPYEVSFRIPPVPSFFGAKHIFDKAKFDEYMIRVKGKFGVDEASVRMTASLHWSWREDKNVKTILREIFDNCVADNLGGPSRTQAIEWAHEIARALRPDLVLLVLGEGQGPPVFKLVRPPKK